MSSTTSGALAGVRVLDLTWGMPGAVAGMLLSDYGAEVIKVERPTTDLSARAMTVTWDRGKRSLVADLREPGDVALLRQLADSADIVLAGLRRGVLDGVGLGAADVRRGNLAVVYCSLIGDREDQSDSLGHPWLAAAKFGAMAESPGHRDGPIFPGHPSFCYSTAMVAVIGTLAALWARLRDGHGEHVEVSMRDGILAVCGGMNWWSERGVSVFQAKERTGRLDFGRYRLLLRIFECADGKLIQVHTGAVGAFARAMEAFGLQEVISKAEGAVQANTLLTEQDVEILNDKLPEIIRTQNADYWLRRLWDHDVACQPVQPPGQVLSDDQVEFAGVVQTVEAPELGSIEVLGPLLKFSDTPATAASSIPSLDRDGSTIRAAGWSSPGLGATTEAGDGDRSAAPLENVSIVEFSSWFAAPFGNRLLSDLGAHVVKVEPLVGDPLRSMPDPCEGALHGKRSLAIDLKSPDAAEVVTRLIEHADVVQHNLRPGVAERLGIDFERVRELNDNVIYSYAPGYGATGPKSQLQSFAPLLSGMVGVNHMSGGAGNEPNGFFGNEDYYNGMFSATGILLALVHRQRTGRGQYVESPQLHSSLLFTSEWYRRDGEIRSALPTLDHEQTGWGPFHRIYQCLIGWIAVACGRHEHTEALLEVMQPAMASQPSGDPTELAEQLQYAFFSLPADEWASALSRQGVPCQVVREEAWLRDHLLDDVNLETGRVLELEHPIHGRVRVMGPLFWFDDHECAERGRSPLAGEHTREVLVELGFEGCAIDGLFKSGIVTSAG